MKLLIASAFFCFVFSLQAQFRLLPVRGVEFSIGGNVTSILTAPTSPPYQVDKSLIPGLGWQAGAVVHLGKLQSKWRMRTGLTAIYRHYHDYLISFGSFLDTGDYYWLVRSQHNYYHDLELPVLFSRAFSLFRSAKICPTLGVVPAWRLRERYTFRRDFLLLDGTQIVSEQTFPSRFNHEGPFNRFNFYASIQWQHTYESGRTLVIEPSFRFNILPFFEGSGLTGPEDETISFGLNVGVLLNRKSREPKMYLNDQFWHH